MVESDKQFWYVKIVDDTKALITIGYSELINQFQ